MFPVGLAVGHISGWQRREPGFGKPCRLAVAGRPWPVNRSSKRFSCHSQSQNENFVSHFECVRFEVALAILLLGRLRGLLDSKFADDAEKTSQNHS